MKILILVTLLVSFIQAELIRSDKVSGKGQLRIMQVDMVNPVSKKMVSTQSNC